MQIKISNNKEQVERIDKLLKKNEEKYGKRYCPCSVVHDDEHVCPCVEFIESTELGDCHCGKYTKVEV